MGFYKFIIKKEEINEYRFVLLPNNSNSKTIGESTEYMTEEECIKGLDRFRRFVKTNNVSESLHINELNDVFYPSIVVDEDAVFSQVRGYPHNKFQCEKWINRVKNNIDAPLRFDILL